MNWMIDDYFVAIGAVAGFIAYNIYLRVELNYYIKHRQELTQLLYGYDPFESSTKLYWSDHFIMSGGINFGLIVAWRDKNHKKLPKEGLRIYAPNIMLDENYRTLTRNHPRLKSFLLAFVLIGLIAFGSAGAAFFLET